MFWNNNTRKAQAAEELKFIYEHEKEMAYEFADIHNKIEQSRYEREKKREDDEMKEISAELNRLLDSGVDSLDPRILALVRRGYRSSTVKPPNIIRVYG